MHHPGIDLSGFLEAHAKALARARGDACPVLVIWRQEIGDVDPAGLLGSLFAPAVRAFTWISPHRGVVALGAAADFSGSGTGRFAAVRHGWEKAVRSVAAGAPGLGATPSLVGGFAFAPRPGPLPEALMWLPRVLVSREPGRPATLALGLCVRPGDTGPEEALRVAAEAAALLSSPATRPARPPSRPAGTVTEIPSGAEWKALVARAVEQIGRGRFAKAVLARQLRVSTPRAADVPAVLAALLDAQPASTVFAVAHDGHAFLGATPERLVGLHAGRAESMSLAASMPRGETPDQDARLRAALLADGKSRREQTIVTAALREAFHDVCRHVTAAGEPHVLDLPGIRHLRSHIVGEVADPETASVLDLVERLHPTPAVGGHPRAAALDWLGEAEPFDRGWYAGPVGWMTDDQEGDFAVALRSAHLHGDTATLYAGCGIVAGSDPDTELAETWLKFRPMLTALAVPAAGPAVRARPR
ncbi:isochorismate synthase [Sphaerisporangium melleum]|uniref:isochorismate synthase n=1 Tax=Sphaerisporangium melleum TaxID=321316 RepID=A0A917RPZ1_9ACTN|nr:isochorismate synthase [Sphaerisporangium melleum]GGL18642.1 isochorismate synthase [Sphaerisporangium melleum]GII74922.1 isochorismate synthase [Sphaerisporangium melleum]